jgi:hypothetical protein
MYGSLSAKAEAWAELLQREPLFLCVGLLCL